jgi:hypothetical protein
MSAAVKCAKCNDTGSLPMSNDLDCTHCGAAVERVSLEASLPRWIRAQYMLDELWRAYLMGKAAGASTWQPIETAPKDGTNVLLVNRRGNIAAGLWRDGLFGERGGWWLRGGNAPNTFFNDHHGPTHWMPLPAAPKAS